MPTSINTDVRVEFLKKDIVLYYHATSGLAKLDLAAFEKADTVMSVYFFNLDGLLAADKLGAHIAPHEFAENLSHKINKFIPHKCIVHTNIIDPLLKKTLNDEKIILIQKNLFDAQVALKTIPSVIPILIGDEGRKLRSSIRLDIYPKEQLRVQVESLSPVPALEKDAPPLIMETILKDLSFGGLALIANDSKELEHFPLKSPIKLKIYLPRAVVRVNLAFVVRNDLKAKEMGVQFDASNVKMVSDDDATTLSTYIFMKLKKALE